LGFLIIIAGVFWTDNVANLKILFFGDLYELSVSFLPLANLLKFTRKVVAASQPTLTLEQPIPNCSKRPRDGAQMFPSRIAKKISN